MSVTESSADHLSADQRKHVATYLEALAAFVRSEPVLRFVERSEQNVEYMTAESTRVEGRWKALQSADTVVSCKFSFGGPVAFAPERGFYKVPLDPHWRRDDV